jgi:hypothetical protein
VMATTGVRLPAAEVDNELIQRQRDRDRARVAGKHPSGCDHQRDAVGRASY